MYSFLLKNIEHTEFSNSRCEPILTLDVKNWLSANDIEWYSDVIREKWGKSFYIVIPSRKEAILFKIRWL